MTAANQIWRSKSHTRPPLFSSPLISTALKHIRTGKHSQQHVSHRLSLNRLFSLCGAFCAAWVCRSSLSVQSAGFSYQLRALRCKNKWMLCSVYTRQGKVFLESWGSSCLADSDRDISWTSSLVLISSLLFSSRTMPGSCCTKQLLRSWKKCGEKKEYLVSCMLQYFSGCVG